MKYIEVQWSFEYDNTLGDLTDEKHDKWLNHPTLSRAYVPEEMVTEGIDVIELAFESLTGIPKKHIVVFDMEPYYMFDEGLEFVDMSDLFKSMSDEDLWQRVVSNEWEFIESRIRFMKDCDNKVIVSLVRRALHTPNERRTALKLIPYLTNGKQQFLINDLIEVASLNHSDIQLCREVILGLPRGWLLDNIKGSLDKVLSNSLSEEYRRLLELCELIDIHLTKSLIEQALGHQDSQVRQVGEDFQKSKRKEYSNKLREVLTHMLEIVNTGGDPKEFSRLLGEELPYLFWGHS